jgi:hypothetical protein
MKTDKRQKIAIVAPIILVVFMYPVFQLAAITFGDRTGWYLGLLVYWVVWGAVFPLWILGKQVIRTLIQPQRPDKRVILLVILPLLMAFAGKSAMGTGREANTLALLLLLSTTFGNGFFEEVLWRGVYLRLFPDRVFYRMIWPSLFFGVWHYAPGSVSPDANLMGLIVGAGLFGLYLSYLARKTNSIWWPMVAHTAGGIIMVL